MTSPNKRPHVQESGDEPAEKVGRLTVATNNGLVASDPNITPTTPTTPAGRETSEARMRAVRPKFTKHTRVNPTGVKNNTPIIRLPAGTKKSSGTQQKWLRAIKKADQGRYRHSVIKDSQTRLLAVKPGKGDEEVNATLLTLDDDELGNEEFPYEALSYHWGEGEESNTIIIQDDWDSKPILSLSDVVDGVISVEGITAKRLYVRPNLYEALKRLRRSDTAVTLWVDALCINQRNEKEKNVQVMKMANIYRKAYNVCIWLGPADTISEQAMNFIREVINQETLGELLTDAKHIPKWKSLFELLKWSWFSRRWVIQELALARDATVHCGSSEVHWDDFRDAIGIFHRYFNFLRPKLTDSSALEPLGAKLLVDMSSNIFRRKPDDTFESTMSLEMLVSTLSGSDTADPRDTINALRNIAKESNLPKGTMPLSNVPPPDYSKDLFQVYRDFLEWVVGATKSLDMLCRHWALPERATKGPMTPRLVKLPSWIQTVDNSAYGRGEDVFRGRKAGDSFVGLPGQSYYNASAGREPKVEFVRDVVPQSSPAPHSGLRTPTTQLKLQKDGAEQDILLVGGLLVGTVTWSSDPIPDGVIPQRCLEKMGWPNEKGEEIRKAPSELWRTLVADRGPNGGQVPTYYHRACLYCLLNRTPNGHINTKELLERNEYRDQPSIVQDYLERVQVVTWNRSFLQGKPPQQGATLEGGGMDTLVGLGPPKTQPNDVIVILYGCSVPVILRPYFSNSETEEPECYEFIGEAYIYGKMDGEAMYDAHVIKDFKLR